MKIEGDEVIKAKHSGSPEILRSTGIRADVKNSVVQEILTLINRSDDGLIPFSSFMDKSMFGNYGYYTSGYVEIGGGETKDFDTASERSFFFGATLGDEVIRTWQAMGSPEDFTLVEMGAGDGGLSESLLEYLKIQSPDLFRIIRYNIVDLGRDLIPRQKARLSKTGKNIQWVNGSATDLPFSNVNGVFLSNELPDAFPVERVVRNKKGELGQVFVGIDDRGEWVEYWGEMSKEVCEYVDKYEISVHQGECVSVNLLAVKFQQNVARALNRGVVITFDYGKYGQPTKDADVRSHAKMRIRKDVNSGSKKDWMYRYVGQVDITADINFEVLENVARDNGLKVEFSGLQGDLMEMLAIEDVIRNLIDNYQSLSWSNILKLSKSIEYYRAFSLGFDHFYGQILSKGLHVEILSSSPKRNARLLELKMKIPVKGGVPGDMVIIDYVRKGKKEVDIVEIDKRGMILVKPLHLENSKMTRDKRHIDESDHTYYDFNDQETLSQLLKELEIKVD